MPDSLLLPAGTRLVHIGPHKTGTTAVQWAFHSDRAMLAENGVHYAGAGSQPYAAVVGLTARRGRLGETSPSMGRWNALVDEIEQAGDQRVVLSCESLANAEPAAIERLVDDLGSDRVHVVRMLRRYDKVLPSQWQQAVAGGMRRPYARWLGAVLSDPQHLFWTRHGYGELTRRWADAVGAQNVSVVVVDETDRRHLLDLFEQLVGLPAGSLHASDSRDNRSLTLNEVEMLRAFNKDLRARHWTGAVHNRYIRYGATPAIKLLDPDPNDERLGLPAWAADGVAEATARGVAEVEQLGVRIIGDLEQLRPATVAIADDPSEPVRVSPQVVAAATAGAIAAALRTEPFTLLDPPSKQPGTVRRLPEDRRPPEFIPTGRLISILLGRATRRARRSVGGRRG